jgi:hypothetical protein
MESKKVEERINYLREIVRELSKEVADLANIVHAQNEYLGNQPPDIPQPAPKDEKIRSLHAKV